MISEVSQMFMRVAGMVQEQGEVVLDIESMTDDTAANTNQAQTELLKLFRFVSSDRALIVKLLIAVLLIGMIMIYFWT
jgi:syntaxin 5